VEKEMIFDKFCGLVERHFKEFEYIVREAKIFYFPAAPHEVLPKGIDVEFFAENFFLPFQVVAVEDSASMIILIDKSKNIQGLYEERLFIECLPLFGDWNNYGDSEKVPESIKENYRKDPHRFKDKYVITFGFVKLNPEGTNTKGYIAEGMIKNSWTCDKNEFKNFMSYYPSPDDINLLSRSTLRNACTAIEEIIYFNTPNRFILEERPISIRKKSFVINSKKIPRSIDRPIYTLLKPKEIREKLGISSHVVTDGGTKKGHYRRRHIRTLRSDVFTKMKGKSIVIPAVWVGPSEVERGNRRYKIMLEL